MKFNYRTYIESHCAAAGIQIDGNEPHDIQVKNPKVFERIFKEQSIGLGESYMDGWWTCERLDLLFFKIYSHGLSQERNSWRKWSEIFLSRVLNLQNRKRSMKVNESHYNIGNDLFERMLGPTMVYTCGYWDYASNLNEAQIHKLDLVCRKMNLQPGQKILDIGCGYGSLLQHAAKNYGVHGVGVTLSTSQAEYAKKICNNLPIEIQVADYREIQGSYDRIFSVGMFEAVGHKNFRIYMKKVFQLLNQNGAFLLHTIGNHETKFPVGHWVDKYIFPHGYIPSLSQIMVATDGLFRCDDVQNFGPSYDHTLMAWHENFEKSWPELTDQYGDRFRRMWEFYLLSFAGGFRAKHWQLWQIVFSKHGAELADLNQARLLK
jgi:cyclopropane-fatty-acyl-phospholipid synthase